MFSVSRNAATAASAPAAGGPASSIWAASSTSDASAKNASSLVRHTYSASSAPMPTAAGRLLKERPQQRLDCLAFYAFQTAPPAHQFL